MACRPPERVEQGGGPPGRLESGHVGGRLGGDRVPGQEAASHVAGLGDERHVRHTARSDGGPIDRLLILVSILVGYRRLVPLSSDVLTCLTATHLPCITCIAAPNGQYIRSYGKLWENSRLLVTVEGRARGSSDPSSWGKIAEFDLPGVHGSETSVNYLHRADLGDTLLVRGGGVRATFRLVNGTVFQINGLALCRSGEKTEGG
ncbi:hypothetical protein THAOC_37773 [Thalassiosira oceanica]|uniref:Uncharacterized protein n=1 Tax=Thalassiosira oceanica TaxID=159749 RepID=K0R5F7_THAOC|nr:hypothetical protein THAOC_37773 [Thalassiosira oceanica]|eukprot:EJK43751.1 hypothetical protein THAOC_37773 [Thalassiosira oceanica]